jgi:hypothetical protein
MFKLALKRIAERLFVFSSTLLPGAAPSIAVESDEWSLRGSLDTNWSRGATDLNGDYKEPDLAWFRRDLAFSIRNKFIRRKTPRRSSPVTRPSRWPLSAGSGSSCAPTPASAIRTAV